MGTSAARLRAKAIRKTQHKKHMYALTRCLIRGQAQESIAIELGPIQKHNLEITQQIELEDT